MDKQMYIHNELVHSEEKCNIYYEWMLRFYTEGDLYQYSKYRELLSHFMGRRRFFLKDLLKVQLKEFDNG